MNRIPPVIFSFLLVTFLALPHSNVANASIIFAGSGNNPEVGANASGEAKFTISGNTLTVELTNTTSPRTTAQGNAMTGVAFNLNSASPVLALTNTALAGGSVIWTSTTASNTSDPLNGSWTSVLGGSPLASYGVATTGFNGRFNGGSITLGNASPDYGIVALNTFDGTNVAFGGSKFPFIQNKLAFTFTGIAGVSESQISGVKLLFGTDGTGIVPGNLVPEPGCGAFMAAAAAWVTCFAKRKRFLSCNLLGSGVKKHAGSIPGRQVDDLGFSGDGLTRS